MRSAHVIINSQAVAAKIGLTIGYTQLLMLRRQIPVSEDDHLVSW